MHNGLAGAVAGLDSIRYLAIAVSYVFHNKSGLCLCHGALSHENIAHGDGF